MFDSSEENEDYDKEHQKRMDKQWDKFRNKCEHKGCKNRSVPMFVYCDKHLFKKKKDKV